MIFFMFNNHIVFFTSFLFIFSEHATEQVLYILFWGGFCVISSLAVYMFGEVFVDSPRLTQAKFKTD